MGEVDAKLIAPTGEETYVRFILAYTDSKTGNRYGKGTVYLDMLSTEARSKWNELIEIIERDWGKIVLTAGSIAQPNDPHAHSAESDQGLRGLGKGSGHGGS